MNKRVLKPLSLAMGTCLVTSLASYTIADTLQNPFSVFELKSGYMIAAGHEGICGEGQCGGARKPGSGEQQTTDVDKKTVKEGQCGEGKCGGNKAESEAVCGIYKVGSAHQGDTSKVKDGVCGGHKPVEMLCGDPR